MTSLNDFFPPGWCNPVLDWEEQWRNGKDVNLVTIENIWKEHFTAFDDGSQQRIPKNSLLQIAYFPTKKDEQVACNLINQSGPDVFLLIDQEALASYCEELT